VIGQVLVEFISEKIFIGNGGAGATFVDGLICFKDPVFSYSRYLVFQVDVSIFY
jgi:hypothetical protein